MLCLSANAKESLQKLMSQIADYLKVNDDPSTLSNVVYTLGQRRTLLKYRTAVVGEDYTSFRDQLLRDLPKKIPRVAQVSKIGFVFSGQGAQWARMGCDLMQSFPVYSAVLKEAEKYLRHFRAEWSLLCLQTSLSCW